MTNIVIIFVLSTNAVCCILLDKNKNIYATFLIIFVANKVKRIFVTKNHPRIDIN